MTLLEEKFYNVVPNSLRGIDVNSVEIAEQLKQLNENLRILIATLAEK